MSTHPTARRLARLALLAAPAWYRNQFADDIAADFDHLFGSPRPRRWWLLTRSVVELLASGFYETLATTLRTVWPGPRPDRRISRLAALERLGWDVRYAVRSARRVPLVTTLAVVSIALGSGATTAIYSAIDAVFFRPLPFPEPDRLVQLPGVLVPIDTSSLRPAGEASTIARPAVDLATVAAMPDVFSHIAAFASGAVNLGSGDAPRRVTAVFVTTGFFDLLGRGAARGRIFDADHTRAGVRVAVLSSRLWQQHFGAGEVLGTTIDINARSYEVIGVMPDDFGFPGDADLWLPLSVPVPIDIVHEAFRNFLPSVVLGRLAPAVDSRAAHQQLAALRQAAPGGQPDADHVVPLRQWLVADGAPALVALLACALVALLVACANVATLLLAKAAALRHDIGIHLVLGATRRRLVLRVLVEGVVIATFGALAGLALASFGATLLEMTIPRGFRGLAPLVVDRRVLAVSLALSTLTVLACSLWPALSATRLTLANGRTTRIPTASRGLVITEVACAFVLTLLAGLFAAKLHAVLSTDVGFSTARVGTARLTLPPARYSDSAASVAFLDDTLARLTSMPGVEAAGAVNSLPFAFEGGITLMVTPKEHDERASSAARIGAPYLVVSPGYFDTLGVRLLEGRSFTPHDGEGERVAVVNRAAARQLWPDGRGLGRTIDYAGQPRNVIGIVDDVRLQLTGDAPAQVYLPIREQPQSYLAIVVRGTEGVSVEALLGRVREAVHGVDNTLPLHGEMSMDDVIGLTVAPRRLTTVFVGSFAVLAVVLAIGGIYGVLSDAAARRTREIGIRMALGASPSAIHRRVAADALGLTAIGVAIGSGTVAVAWPYLSVAPYDLVSVNPVAAAGTLIVFAAVALAAAYVPGRRAAGVDPVVALRHE